MRHKGYFRLAAVTFCIAALFGCQSKGPGAEAGKKEQKGQVLAEVNGAVITTEDFKKEVEILPAYLKQMAASPDGRKEMLDSMVVRELVLQDAQKQGVDKSPEVAAKMEDMKKRVIVEAYLKKKVAEQADIADADLQKFYDQNKEKFKTGEQIKASHILVKSEKEAQDVLTQLKGGAKFEDLARKFSTDPAGQKGGDLGWFGKDSMIPEFEKVAFALKEGQVSGVVKTKFGYHIIKLVGKRPAGVLPFAEVKEQLKASLLPEKQQEVFKKVKEELKKSAKLSVKEDVLMGIGANGGEAKTPPVEGKQK
ncbi:MAG: peptidylprolyl isomerase [Geobacteraceae bacterium]|nr:peptidylprolyl isomerase [Geobacteraceae bacterium]